MTQATTITSIQTRVARHYGLKLDELLGRDRHKTIMTARQLAMLLCRELLDASYPEIGRAFDRDHATCMHNIETIRLRIRCEARLRNTYEVLRCPTRRVMGVRYRVAI